MMVDLSFRRLALVIAMIGIAMGCASSDTTDDTETNGPDSTPRESGLDLAPQDESIRTVQLYRGDNEIALPVVERGSAESLTLEFDLMAQQGRPLSISFQHADRSWSRDLSPNQILESYHDDRLVDYRTSQGTTVPYVHYTYQFPNDDIRFRLSGNYILRVTDRSRENSVLFERPFFISDQTGRLQAGGQSFVIPGQQRRSLRPVARYQPPQDIRGTSFGYTACFVRNGRLPDTRCRDRPQLAQASGLEFELPRSRAFAPTTADYAVDLGSLRGGPSIERTDRTDVPIDVLLEPDYAQFGGGDFDASLNGQIVVGAAIRGRADPELTAEYVDATFAFVPPEEEPLAGGVTVAGSFSGMDPERGMEMQWNPTRARYEREMLLKQGRYQYFYQSPDDRLKQAARNAQSRLQNIYTTFLYYRDPSQGTDRLLRVGSFAR